MDVEKESHKRRVHKEVTPPIVAMPLMQPPQIWKGDSQALRNLNLPEDTRHRIRATIQAKLKQPQIDMTLSDIHFNVSVGQITDSSRAIGSIEITKKIDGSTVLGPYLVKKSHGKKEADAIKKSGQVPYVPDSLYCDNEAIVEELLPETIGLKGVNVGTNIRDRGPHLVRRGGGHDEILRLGERFAEMVYGEFESGLLWSVGYVTGEKDTGGIRDTHIKLMGRGRNIRPVLLDWNRSIDIKKLKHEDRIADADAAVTGHIMMLLSVVHRCVNDGPDARLWASFERTLVNVCPGPGNTAASMYFRRVVDDVKDIARNPTTWGGDEQVAADWTDFFSNVFKAARGKTLVEKPMDVKTRLVRDLNTRNIAKHHAEAIIDYLESIVDEDDVFRGLNFVLSEGEGDIARGQGVLTVRGPEPNMQEIVNLNIHPVISREDALLASRASDGGIGTPVLYMGRDTLIDVASKPNAYDKVRSMCGWEDKETAFRLMGDQMAVMLARMVFRNTLMDKDQNIGDSFVITGDNALNTKVALTNWVSAPGLLYREDSKRDDAIKKFMDGVLTVCGHAGEDGVFIWHEFEKTLSKRARSESRRKLYESLLDEFKTQSSSRGPAVEHFYHEAGSVGPTASWSVPPEVEAAMTGCSIKNIPDAWNRMRHMCELSPAWLEAQKIPAKEAKALMKQRRKEFTVIAIDVLAAIKESKADPDTAIKGLRSMGTIYDAACATVHSKRFMGKGEQKEPLRDKIDLYKSIAGNGDAVEALTDQRAQRLADILGYRSAYLAKTMIELICEKPQVLDGIITAQYRPSTAEDFDRELNDHMADVDKTKGMTDPADIESVHDQKVQALKHFSQLGLIRLGFFYTEAMKALLSDSAVKGLYEEMSNNSQVVLGGAYDIERERLVALYGEPSSKFAIVLSGASARREFPSFDWDAVGFIEREGETAGGPKGKLTNEEFHNQLFDQMAKIAPVIGHHLDREMSPEDPAGRTLNCKTPGTFFTTVQKMADEDAFVLLGLENLTYGCGDESFADKVMQQASELMGEKNLDAAAAQLIRREKRDMVWKTESENVKYTKGGLRDLMDVMMVYRLVENLPQKNIFDIIDAIHGVTGDDTKDESGRQDTNEPRQQLMESYLWLMNLRVRLDLEYGRQEKFLPENRDLHRFVRLLGYRDGEHDAVETFMEDYQMHTQRVREITDDQINHLRAKHPGLNDKVTDVRKYLETVRKRMEAEEQIRLQQEMIANAGR